MIPFKVCCIQDRGEMEAASRAGAAFAGLVGAMPSGPGPVSDARIRGIVKEAPEEITPVLLTARKTASDVVDHLRDAGLVERLESGLPAGVQLVRHLPRAVRNELRARLPGLVILQVLHVEDEASVERTGILAPGADYLLLDSGRPEEDVLGGTGRTHDWTLSREVVARSPVPVLLAGGLRPGNVGDAVQEVGPWGVDVCSGLRGEGGNLDPDLLHAFARALASAS